MQVMFKLETVEIRRAVILLLRWRALPFLGSVSALLVAAVLIYFSQYSEFALLFFLTAVTGLILAIRFVVITSQNIGNTYHRMGASTYTFAEQGISIQSDVGFLQVPWTEFSECLRYDGLILLNQVNQSVLILPERAFTHEQWARMGLYLQGLRRASPGIKAHG